MARKRRHEEPENHERWLVSYADFITLLFAFFVVMYSTSSINEGKYRVLSDSLMGAFKNRERSIDPIQVGKLVRTPYVDDAPPVTSPVSPDVPTPGESEGAGTPGSADGDPQGGNAAMEDIDALAKLMGRSVLPQIDEDLVEVRRHDDWLEVEIKTSILFPSGSARLNDAAIPILESVADVLKGFPNPVQVEGFTDNVPIHTVAFPSNWELSAARAASVVHLFMKYGVRPDRMLAIGYGEHRPLAENDTPDGRSKNRRVVIVIPAGEDTRKHLEVDRLENGATAGPSPGPVRTPAPTGPVTAAPRPPEAVTIQ